MDSDGQSRAWWYITFCFPTKMMSDKICRGIFTPATFFNDLGFTLTPDSMISFQLAVLPLLLGSVLIVIGNTGFPCALRFIMWLMSKLVPTTSGIWEELKFLLDHPRRCFTLLFPGDATWWLFWILVVLNGIDVIFFIILDVRYQFNNGLSIADVNTSSMTLPSHRSILLAIEFWTVCSKPLQREQQVSQLSTSPTFIRRFKYHTSS